MDRSSVIQPVDSFTTGFATLRSPTGGDSGFIRLFHNDVTNVVLIFNKSILAFSLGIVHWRIESRAIMFYPSSTSTSSASTRRSTYSLLLTSRGLVRSSQ